MIARPATPEDADELVRLRAVMLGSLNHGAWDDQWREPTRRLLVGKLGDPVAALAAYVVDRPAGPGLAACAVGTIEQRLGSPGNPDGRSGYVFSVATDPDMRRRGFSRACLTGLLEWFAGRGVRRVTLMASPDGEALYESLGFARSVEPAMRLRLDDR
nr:GNAT family N-acetyltransferase [uncultured Actinoplanes sp.]